MEGGTGDERAEGDALSGDGEARQQRPRVPRPALRPPVVAVEQVVADPDRVEADLLGRAGHRGVLRPPHVPLDLGELHADTQGSRHGAQPATQSLTGAETPSTEKSPSSRILSAAAAIAATATQVSAPPTLTRRPPASTISRIESPG